MKYVLAPSTLKFRGVVPGATVFSRYVPAGVPSVVHSTSGVVLATLLAAKNILPFSAGLNTGGRFANPPAVPGRMSFTSEVPASVPSVTHNSRPWSGSVAVKTQRLLPRYPVRLGSELSVGLLRSP